ncbi:HAD family hydrolase [Candidatus Gracilibacteria bacterium]|nr:HAD family hydrolase [Candidatus Gracilibacteria bacterium]
MTTKFLDTEGRVIDHTIAEEMAYIEKPYRETPVNFLKRIFNLKSNEILLGEMVAITHGEELFAEKEKKEAEELARQEEEKRKEDEIEEKKGEELMKIENKEKVSSLMTGFEEKKGEMDDFEKREIKRQTKLYEELTKIYETGGIEGLCNKLGVRHSINYGDYNCINAEGIISKLFKMNQREIFSPLIDKVAQIYITTDKFDDHSLCHLFEDYGRSEEEYSFLDKPSLRETAELLVNTAIIRGGGNLYRTLGAFTRLALEDIENGNLDEFTFRPEGFNTEGLGNRFDREYNMKLIRFCESKTPREFLQKMGELQIKDLTEKMKKKEIAEGVLDITCVDVDGTLIKDGELYLPLVNKLTRNILSGKKVVIFSGGDPEMQTERLRELGLDEVFLPVVPKEMFKGIEVHTIIDDTEAEGQGLLCVSYLNAKWIS